MKQLVLLSQIILLSFFSFSSTTVSAQENKKITHVVMVWLKQPGNAADRTAFIKASKQLSNLPGIINRHVGVVETSDRSIVDDTFDVAVTVTMKNKAALRAYLNHPRHKSILKEKIKTFNRTYFR